MAQASGDIADLELAGDDEFAARVEEFLDAHCRRIGDPTGEDSDGHGGEADALLRTRAFQGALA